MNFRRTGTLTRFVWRHSRREQVFLLLLTVSSFPVVYATLEVPKIIVNDAISGTDFPREVLGLALDQVPYLLALSGLFLGLVVLHNAMKWVINVGLGMAGERLLRRLRYDLTERVARFPMPRLRGVRQGETIQSIMGEIEPLGGFFGEVLVTPIFQAGLLAVYVAFIFVQDVWLGLAAVAFYPVQTVVVPMLQARIVALNRQRAANARTVAERVGDVIRLSPEMRSHATTPWHLAEVDRLLARNTEIRQAIFRRKYTIKFLNNFLSQLTPFLFYAIGGYLVIEGRLDFGALVAVLAAYKDLAGPWKALLGYWQRLSDFSARYVFVRDAFESETLLPLPEPGAAAPLDGPLVLARIEADPATERPAIDRLEIAEGETVLVQGGSASARGALLRLAAGIDPPETGAVSLGGTDLRDAPGQRVAATLALAPPSPGLIEGSLRANLLYGLLRPGDGGEEDGLPGRVDLAAAGVDGPEALEARLMELLAAFALDRQLRAIALGRMLDPDEAERWSTALMTLRADLAAESELLEDLVEPWEPGRYNTNGSVLANMLFGLPVTPAPAPAHHLDTPALRGLLRRSGGDALLLEIGWRIAEALSELAATMTEGSGLLDRLAGFSRQDVLDAAAITAGAGVRGPERVGRTGSRRLRGLAANFVETRDQLDILDDATRARVLEVRALAIRTVRESPAFVPFDAERFHPARTIADNILHGRRRFDRRAGWDRLDARIESAIAARGLGPEVLRIGIDAPASEAALPASVLRRIGLVRAVLRRPRLLLVAGGAGLHPGGEAGLIAELARQLPGSGLLIATETRDDRPAGVDRVLAIGPDGRLEPGP